MIVDVTVTDSPPKFEKDQRRKNPMYFAENTHHAGFQRAFRQRAQQEAMEDRKGGIGNSFTGEAIISGTSRLRCVFIAYCT